MRRALFALLCVLTLRADIFSDQHRQLVDYYEAEMKTALAKGPREPGQLAARLGVTPVAIGKVRRTLLATWPSARIEEASIEVEPGHTADALLLTPPKPNGSVMIAIGPATEIPESWAGLTQGKQPAVWLASLLGRGYTVCLALTVQRTTDHAVAQSTRGKDRRHVLHRLAFVTGRTVTGLEVSEVRTLAAWLKQSGAVGLYGEGDGGRTARYAAAIDKGTYKTLNLVSYTDPGGDLWKEPVDTTIWGQAVDLGFPKNSLPALEMPQGSIVAGERLVAVEVEERRNRHYDTLLKFLRARIEQSGRARRERHSLAATAPAQAVPKLLADLKALMGEVPAPVRDMNARVVEIARTDAFAAFDVKLDVLPGVEAIGHLLVPLKREGRLPAVVTQHGLGGKPKDLTLQGPEPNSAYHGYAARLAEHGYVVFAPYVVVPIPQAELINPLVRMTNALGRMRTNIEVAKLRRIVDFLQSLDYVDAQRLGYYGLSYGGYSTIWMGPLEPRFKATVVSGHFNDWTPKIANELERTSYLQHPDEDFYNWNVLNRMSHVELLAAFWPRAVMVEFALHDSTTYPVWHEKAWTEVEQIAKVWNATGRMVRDRFVGIHEIHGIGAFEFLDRWLRPEEPSRREFPHWGEVTQELTENRLTWVRGRFRAGTADPVFRGLAFRVQGDVAPTVRYGMKEGGAELGTIAATVKDGWAEAPLPPKTIDPAQEFWFELRAGSSRVTLSGPKPLGGSRFAQDFAVTYRPLTK